MIQLTSLSLSSQRHFVLLSHGELPSSSQHIDPIDGFFSYFVVVGLFIDEVFVFFIHLLTHFFTDGVAVFFSSVDPIDVLLFLLHRRAPSSSRIVVNPIDASLLTCIFRGDTHHRFIGMQPIPSLSPFTTLALKTLIILLLTISDLRTLCTTATHVTSISITRCYRSSLPPVRRHTADRFFHGNRPTLIAILHGSLSPGTMPLSIRG